jgi:hypothetical protein
MDLDDSMMELINDLVSQRLCRRLADARAEKSCAEGTLQFSGPRWPKLGWPDLEFAS